MGSFVEKNPNKSLGRITQIVLIDFDIDSRYNSKFLHFVCSLLYWYIEGSNISYDF